MANRLGILGRTVELYVRFLDAASNPVNADSTPSVEILDTNGTIIRSSNNSGVMLADDPGLYLFTYELPINGVDGYWNDNWTAVIGGQTVESMFEFQVIAGGTVSASEMSTNTPGDDYEFSFNKEEVEGINRLLKVLKKRLKNDGMRKSPDPENPSQFINTPCPVFNDNELICFLVNGLSEFNQYPHFTNFTFADDVIQDMFMDIIVQGALILALAAQSLIERGREFNITDNGVTYQPPQLSEILNTQYNAQLQDYKEKLKIIKCNIKPSPLSIGTYRISSVSPAYARLRHIRGRSLI